MKTSFFSKTPVVLVALCFGLHSCKKENIVPVLGDCSLEPPTSIPTIQKLGISPTYKGDYQDWTKENIAQSIGITAQLGADVIHFGFIWSDLQLGENDYDWELTDKVVNTVNQNGQKLSLTISLINTSDADDVPDFVSFSSFDDTNLIEKYTNFIKTFLARYGNKIDYLWIGNEIDEYFSEHPNELPAYKSFFMQVYQSVKPDYASVKIGLTFTYHGAVNNELTDIYGEFEQADILGFTIYSQFISKKPKKHSNHIEDLISITETIGKPIAITETTWSSAGFHGSPKNQELFVETAIEAFKNNRNHLEFYTFWGIYDYPQSYIEASLITDKELTDWLTTLSFVTNDGQPKQSYCKFITELKEL